jgi:hypothetical protein
MIEKEPVTVILSAKGWIRAARGHLPPEQDWKFKDGDGPAFALHAQTTDKILLAADDGRFFTLGCDKLPGARGFGEPVRTMIELESDPDEWARLLEVERPRVTRSVTGLCHIPRGRRNQIIARWGPRAQTFLDAIDLARADTELYAPWSNDAGEKYGERKGGEPPLVSTHVFDDGTDTRTYTIAEWRERFGAPGSHADVHGRQFGAYTTED